MTMLLLFNSNKTMIPASSPQYCIINLPGYVLHLRKTVAVKDHVTNLAVGGAAHINAPPDSIPTGNLATADAIPTLAPRKKELKVEGSKNTYKQNVKVVQAAIDIGTTHSGYAFLFNHEYITEPSKIHTNNWTDTAQNQVKVKTSTCLLLHSDTSLHSFGHRAKANYHELVLDNKHQDYYFFWNFKMKLHQQQVRK